MNAFEELGFTGDARAHEQQQPAPKHRWELKFESHGVTRHQCHNCRAFRTRTRTDQSDGLPVTGYLALGVAYDNAPPCRGRR
jgi:hypothetical protein